MQNGFILWIIFFKYNIDALINVRNQAIFMELVMN